MTQRPLVSIIVVTVNTPSLTEACFQSVVRNTTLPYELIVVNNSPAQTIRRCLGTFGQIRLIQNSRNEGYAKAANQGALASRGQYLCFLNSDTLVPPRWLERLVEAAQIPGVGAVGPNSQKTNDRYRYRWPPAHLPASDQTTALADEAFQRWGRNRLDRVRFLWGFCLLIPKAVMERVGLFDEGFFFGMEDNDYCLRLRLHGYYLLRVGTLFVHHQGSVSSSPERRRRLSQQAKRCFAEKWLPPRNRKTLHLQSILDAAERSVVGLR